MAGRAQTNQGFLESLGLGPINSYNAFIEGSNARAGVSRNATNTPQVMFNSGAQGARGLAVGIQGLVGGIKSFGDKDQSFGQGFKAGAQDAKDRVAAGALGLEGGAEELQRKRELTKKIKQIQSTITNDGSYENRIKLAQEVARVASQAGDIEVQARALEQISLLEREREEFEKLEGQNRKAKREEEMKAELGFEAREVGDPEGTKGKAVRINEGENAGKYLLVRPGQPDKVVDGKDLIAPGLTGAKPRNPLAQDTLQGLVKANGATSGQIAKMRGHMNSLAENSQIVSNIADNLLSANDPQGVLAQAGKAAIAADKAVSFVESVSGAFTDPRSAPSRLTYNGKAVSAAKQYELATDRSLLARFANDLGFENVNEMLPENIRGNAIAAEQYWANVMELAYLDARLMEPSNRGLSDNDVINALKRIGADTANPLSFAVRQLEVIDTKLLPQLDNLGSDFTNFNSPIYSQADIVNAVYNPQRRQAVRNVLMDTRSKLVQVLEQGRRGENEVTEELSDDEFLDGF